jgi:hypothetical protein
MDRQDYDEIRAGLEAYIRLWDKKELGDVDRIFTPHVTFTTSTSLTMPDGAQHSLFGIRDFLTDFPYTSTFSVNLLNYVCRMQEEQAVTYAEAVCTAAEDEKHLFYFTAVLIAGWEKTDHGWRIYDLKQEIISGGGELEDRFAEKWYFDRYGERDSMIQGEADSPWNRIAESEAPLTEEEQIQEILYKYFYGIEHEVFQYCYDTVSVNFGAYTQHGMGESRRKLLAEIKKIRRRTKYETHGIRISGMEIEDGRAYINADSLLERPLDHLDKSRQYSCCRYTFELEKQPDGWKIVYMDEYPGIYVIQ